MPAGDQSVLPSERDRADRAVPRLAAVGSSPICRAPDSEVIFRSLDILPSVPGEFTYRRCVSCRTVFQDPRVIAEDIPLCYPDGYTLTQQGAWLLDPEATSRPHGAGSGCSEIGCGRARLAEAVVLLRVVSVQAAGPRISA